MIDLQFARKKIKGFREMERNGKRLMRERAKVERLIYPQD